MARVSSSRRAHSRISGCYHRAHGKNRKNLRSHQNQENGIPDRYAEGSRGQAGRKTQIRSKGALVSPLSTPLPECHPEPIRQGWAQGLNVKDIQSVKEKENSRSESEPK